MYKNEFLKELSDSLIGQVSKQEYDNSMSYYNNYIENAMKAGQKEQEVITNLGSGRLIAKSIIEAYSQENDGQPLYTQSDYNEQNISEEYNHHTQKSFSFDFNTWYGKIAKVLIFIVALIIIWFILKWVVFPVAVIAIAVYAIKRILRS